jgi:hypothetical protein
VNSCEQLIMGDGGYSVIVALIAIPLIQGRVARV